jgi:hypothetical protein
MQKANCLVDEMYIPPFEIEEKTLVPHHVVFRSNILDHNCLATHVCMNTPDMSL